MKIIFLPRYAANGASSRYRLLQFFDYFREQKVNFSSQSFFDEKYLLDKYSGKKISAFYLMSRYFKRFLVVFKIRSYDLVVIEKEIFPSLPIFFDKIFYFLNKNWVVDYDDAVQVLYENKMFLGNKIADVIKLSRAVVVANQNMYDYAKKYNATVYLIPDAIKSETYLPKSDYSNHGKIVIGWAGSQSTKKFLDVIVNCLQKIAKEIPIVLRCIGISGFDILGVEVENIKWNEEKEPGIIRNFDIGIMPLTDDPFSRGKSSLKIIQYFAAGVPAVASPVGFNKNVIKSGDDGFLADSELDWEKYLKMLIKDQELRKKIGQSGRRSFEENFAFSKIAPQMLSVYLSLTAKK